MDYLWSLLRSVGRIVFKRGSPERIYYTRRLFIVSLLLALLASGAVQYLWFSDHLVFVVLRVFAEVTMFMVMIVLLTAKIARFRLARMMLVLVLISLLADMLLVLASPIASLVNLQPELKNLAAYVIAAVAMYGAGNVLAWGLQRTYLFGIGTVLLYVIATVALDQTFRGLYEVMAATA
jgi:hypothetical protein